MGSNHAVSVVGDHSKPQQRGKKAEGVSSEVPERANGTEDSGKTETGTDR